MTMNSIWNIFYNMCICVYMITCVTCYIYIYICVRCCWYVMSSIQIYIYIYIYMYQFCMCCVCNVFVYMYFCMESCNISVSLRIMISIARGWLLRLPCTGEPHEVGASKHITYANTYKSAASKNACEEHITSNNAHKHLTHKQHYIWTIITYETHRVCMFTRAGMITCVTSFYVSYCFVYM